MDIGEWYAIALGSLLVVLFVWHLAVRTSAWRKRGVSAIRKQMSQGVPIARPGGTASVSFSAGVGLMLIATANILASVLGISTREQLAHRLAIMSLLNMVLLSAGGRTNIVADVCLGISLQNYALFHRWLGRICVTQALIHAILHMQSTFIWQSVSKAGVTGVAYRNIGGKAVQEGSLFCLGQDRRAVRALTLEVELRWGWNLSSGQQFQAHPYLIAWTDEETNGASRAITLLIECRGGFSSALRLAQTPVRLLVDGPYGRASGLDVYDKVLLIASGAGVAAHLLAIRELLQAHNDQTARVRRITLLWFLEDKDQESWVRSMIDALFEMDRRRIFTLLLYVPPDGPSASGPAESAQPDTHQARFFRITDALDLLWVVNQESIAEAGICGTPDFEKRVRNAIRASKHDIRLVTSLYQMDENPLSRKMSGHYNNKSATSHL
ncbi:hypothetical protein LTR53_005109 [Teratosphaeriaceae sp. CCFEE 6253]|nr:hypothetical protein LTR53_005109 [Teratosphaeriaceae sp. CCFEE 6253]